MRVLGVAVVLLVSAMGCALGASAGKGSPVPETDVTKTSAGELKTTFVGHGTLMFTLGETIIHVDPLSREADYAKMRKADLILITHEHKDHLVPVERPRGRCGRDP